MDKSIIAFRTAEFPAKISKPLKLIAPWTEIVTIRHINKAGEHRANYSFISPFFNFKDGLEKKSSHYSAEDNYSAVKAAFGLKGWAVELIGNQYDESNLLQLSKDSQTMKELLNCLAFKEAYGGIFASEMNRMRQRNHSLSFANGFVERIATEAEQIRKSTELSLKGTIDRIANTLEGINFVVFSRSKKSSDGQTG